MRRLSKAKYLDNNVVRSRKTNIISDTRPPTWGTSQESTFHGKIMAQKNDRARIKANTQINEKRYT